MKALRADPVMTHLPFLDRLADLGELWLRTDDGIRWRLAQYREPADK